MVCQFITRHKFLRKILNRFVMVKVTVGKILNKKDNGFMFYHMGLNHFIHFFSCFNLLTPELSQVTTK